MDRPDVDPELALADDELWGEDLLAAELEGEWGRSADEVRLAWFCFDRPMSDGRLPVDVVLASHHDLDRASRIWLTTLRESC